MLLCQLLALVLAQDEPSSSQASQTRSSVSEEVSANAAPRPPVERSCQIEGDNFGLCEYLSNPLSFNPVCGYEIRGRIESGDSLMITDLHFLVQGWDCRARLDHEGVRRWDLLTKDPRDQSSAEWLARWCVSLCGQTPSAHE